MMETRMPGRWIGLVEVSPLPGCEMFRESANAFTNVVGLADSKEQFSAAVDTKCRALKLQVHELRDIEPCASRFAGKIVPDEIQTALGALTKDEPVEFGTFYVYDVE
jgi:hypothetical protein